MKKDRLGLVLIAASLLAIAVVGALVYRNGLQVHRQNIRVSGTALTRAVSGMESASDASAAIAGFDREALLRSLHAALPS